MDFFFSSIVKYSINPIMLFYKTNCSKGDVMECHSNF